ncbi:MAG TPA: hypothetical protein VFP12_04270 [Allosphingosinicella sp.]|nr:hypothetical protein [Allosphingosinicella sp.]
MMIRTAAFMVLMLAPAALAAQTPQTGQGRLEIVGEAPGACVVRGPATATATNASYTSIGPSGGQVRITEMVSSPQSLSLGATVDIALTVVCNSPHQLLLRSENGGMLRNGSRPGAASGPFAEFLPYEFRAAWLGRGVSSTSNGPGPLVMQSNQGGAGQLSLGVVLPEGVRLAGGDYRDAVILEFRAAE